MGGQRIIKGRGSHDRVPTTSAGARGGGQIMGRLHKLNVSKVGSLKEPDLYSDGGCLHLRVAPGGSKQWVFRYSLGHRTRDYGVGPYPTLSLAEARDRAHGLRKLPLDTIDPIEH